MYNDIKNFCKAHWLPIALIILGILIVLVAIGSIFFWIHWIIGLIYIGIVLFALGCFTIFVEEELIKELKNEYVKEELIKELKNE